MELLLFNIFNGLIIGIFYALMALGLSLILGLNGIINFSHGGFLALGGYIAYSLSPVIGFWGALIVSPFIVGLLGLVVERVLIRPLYSRDPLFSLLLTFGLAMIMEDLIRTFWGANGLPFNVPAALSHPLSQTYFFVTGYRVFLVVLALLAIGSLFALLRYTRIGVRIRAGNADLETVSALGINIYQLRAINFGVGILFAGLAGVLAAGRLGLTPTMGASLIMPSFVAIIVGGVGSLLGSLLGGIIIGVAAGIVTTYYPAASDVVIYVIMGVVLVVRPRGLLGQEGLLE
ncbi:branched-chain amino acid ABC transporter permease [Salinisphaera sp. RV14]|uniref:branched-chain amino acid ABC transporter permease n=1 Tax=unclassified Salinisphaera TaxID=2649847 RepID=UPI000D705051|nr:branched-chain amino acid ABC transporter permease [Salinisphaera sp. LB1]AWN14546.1 High-affinity branched-chain amino acid transport system permease protein LivH [Salinisphaera sp. LB1]